MIQFTPDELNVIHKLTKRKLRDVNKKYAVGNAHIRPFRVDCVHILDKIDMCRLRAKADKDARIKQTRINGCLAIFKYLTAAVPDALGTVTCDHDGTVIITQTFARCFPLAWATLTVHKDKWVLDAQYQHGSRRRQTGTLQPGGIVCIDC